MTPDGLFIQWVQSYEIDPQTLRTLYATMASTFPYVETWETRVYDLVLIGAKHPIVYRTTALAARIQEEPFRSALRDVWRAVDLAGFLAHYVAGDPLARAIAAAPDVVVNTDDRNVVEFGLARSVGDTASSLTTEIRQLAATLGDERPPLDDLELVQWPASTRHGSLSGLRRRPVERPGRRTPQRRRSGASCRAAGVLPEQSGPAALRAWRSQAASPRDPNELAMLSGAVAETGSEDALPLIEQLRAYNAGEADTLLGELRYRQSRFDDAAAALERAFQEYRRSPGHCCGSSSSRSTWPKRWDRAVRLLRAGCSTRCNSPSRWMPRTYNANWCAQLSRERRTSRACAASRGAARRARAVEAEFLSLRRECFAITGDRRFDQAERDLIEFQSHEPMPLGAGIAGP